VEQIKPTANKQITTTRHAELSAWRVVKWVITHKIWFTMGRLIRLYRRIIIRIGIIIVIVCIFYSPLIFSIIKPKLITKKILPSDISSINTAFSYNELVNTNSRKDPLFNYSNLGINAPLIVSKAKDPMNVADWKTIQSDLERGVSLVYKDNSFNEASLVYVVGHSSSNVLFNPYSYVFASLNQAKRGDKVTLIIDKKYEYQVTDTRLIYSTAITEFKKLQPAKDSVQRLVMVTCWPVFTSNQYRKVVIAERPL
jgi:LPXTG-site transpeptidase (sortase) family protein